MIITNNNNNDIYIYIYIYMWYYVIIYSNIKVTNVTSESGFSLTNPKSSAFLRMIPKMRSPVTIRAGGSQDLR